MTEPSSGKARPGRTRAACSACRSVKQRCDGAPSKGACKRCLVYGLECDYDGVPISSSPRAPAASPSTPAATAAATAASGSSAPYPSPTPTQILRQQPAPKRPSTFVPPSNQTDPGVAAALRAITERLRMIEVGLEADRTRNPMLRNPTAAAATPTAPHLNTAHSWTAGQADSPSESDDYNASSVKIDMPAESNPLQILEQTIDKIESLSVGKSPEWNESQPADEHQDTASPFSAPPDAIARGLVTLADCEAAFTFFHERIQPWVSVMGNADDRIALLVQARSPFLFHVVLLVTNFYNTSTSQRAREVYSGLCEIVNTLLAWHILAPDAKKTNADFVRALIILLFYKPVQHAAMAARGVTDSGRASHMSKVNALSSVMLQSIVHKMADHIGINHAPKVFVTAVSNASATNPVSTKVLSDLRLHYWLCMADIHGSLHSGRMTATDPSDAVKSARIFAGLRSQPCDPRRAATVELYALARAPNGVNAVAHRLDELDRINDDLERWSTYWAPILSNSQMNGDPLAYTAHSNLLQFVTFIANAAVFTRWTIEKQRLADSNQAGRPELSASDWKKLQRAVDAAQNLVFAVSLESVISGEPLRRYTWPEASGRTREPLRLDMKTVEDYRTGLDTMTCVGFISSLILLVRMSTSGLVSCDLVCRKLEYEGNVDLHRSRPLAPRRKLSRLLELGGAFLHAVAPNRYHPARKHAALVQMMLKAGLGGSDAAVAATTASDGPSPPLDTGDPEDLEIPPQPVASTTTTTAAAQYGASSWMWRQADAPGLALSNDGAAIRISNTLSAPLTSLYPSGAPEGPDLTLPTNGDDRAVHMNGMLTSEFDDMDPHVEQQAAMEAVLSDKNDFFGEFYDMGAGDPALTDDLGFSETLAMGGSMDWNMPDL